MFGKETYHFNSLYHFLRTQAQIFKQDRYPKNYVTEMKDRAVCLSAFYVRRSHFHITMHGITELEVHCSATVML